MKKILTSNNVKMISMLKLPSFYIINKNYNAFFYELML